MAVLPVFPLWALHSLRPEVGCWFVGVWGVEAGWQEGERERERGGGVQAVRRGGSLAHLYTHFRPSILFSLRWGAGLGCSGVRTKTAE